MGCLSWPQKKALKIAFKIIERQLGDDSNQNNLQGNQQGNMNMGQMPLQQNQQSNKAQNIKLAMNLVGKVLDL